MVAASGLATIPLQKSRFFCFAGRKKSLAASDFGVSLKSIRRKLAATTAASRRSRAISWPQRPRDTKFWNQGVSVQASLLVRTASSNRPEGEASDKKSVWISAAQHINFISPQNAEIGDPKIRNRGGPGNSGKFRFSVEFLQKPSIQVIPGNPFWGPHFQRFGGIFWGK